MKIVIDKAYLAAKAKRLAIRILVALAVVLPVRASVITAYRVQGNSVAPELTDGSRILVYRLASDFRGGDIVAYSSEGKTFVGRFTASKPDGIRLSRNGEDATVARDQIIGKVVVATR